MEITVLASGSRGNATLIKTENINILIDIGISYKRLSIELNQLGLNGDDIDIILLTHEHIDHVAGLRVFLKNHQPTVISTNGTLSNLPSTVELKKIVSFNYYDKFNLQNLEITFIPTSHDSSEACGFILEEKNFKVVHITDTGYIKEELLELLENADAYILEFNHDAEMLLSTNRPWHLKQRIISDVGHLSNEDASYFLTKVLGPKTKAVFPSHLSQEANLYDLFEKTLYNCFDDYNIDKDTIKIYRTYQNQQSDTFKIEKQKYFVCDEHIEDYLDIIIENGQVPIINQSEEGKVCKKCKSKAIYTLE